MSDKKDNRGAVVVRPDRPPAGAGRGAGAGRELAEERKLPRPTPLAPAQPLETPLPSGPDAAQYAQILLDMRRTRKRRFFLRLALFVALPTLVTLLYTLYWATPRYVSEFEITYQMYQAPKTLSSGLVQSAIGTSQSNTVDIDAILYEYIRSAALLSKLNAKLGLRTYYSSRKIDYLSRLDATASRERFLDYFRRHVSVSEGLGGFLTVDVTAFDPKFSLALAKAVVQACDEMVDNMTSRARQDEMRFAEDEVGRQEDRIRKARRALTAFQNAHGDLNPQNVATQLGQIVGSLESQLATARAELGDALANMRADSPRVVQIKYMISALEQQLRQEQGRLANTGGNTPYSQILDQYSALQLEEEFAKDAYLSAQQGLAVARADAARKQNYLVDFAPPSEPDKATQYFPLVYTTTAFVVSLLAFGIGSLMVGAFRDQAGI